MTQTNLNEVLEEYAIAAGAKNDHEILRAVIEKYPQFADDLMNFAAARAFAAFSPETEISTAEEAEFQKFGLEHLRRVLSGASEQNAAMPLSLTETAKAKGLNKAKFAAALDISLSLVMYLEHKRLEFVTIPQTIIGKIAQLLDTSEDSIAEYLNQPPNFAAGASYKAETRPENDLKPKKFAEAVREDQQLSTEQKRKLLEM